VKPEQWVRVRKILDAALELAPDARAAFIANSCGADPDLRRDVESLLAANDDAGNSFLESPAVPRIVLAPGAKLGSYEIVGIAGAGGMGEVYRARDTVLGREVAIKVLPSILSRDADRLRRFEQEARAAAALNHPNILSIHQFGTQDNFPYMVSEFLEGETLRVRLERGPLPVGKAIDYTLQMLNGLAAAHEKNIVHRDLKPENLFLTTSGWLKILDFGLAKLQRPQELAARDATPTLASGTVPGMIIGTVGYMSPEQVPGQEVDHRSDIFALGAIFYEMLSGKRAFQGATPADTLTAILNHDPPALIGTIPNITPPLDRIIHRCLEKDPKERFQSAKEAEFALRALSDAGPFAVGDAFKKLPSSALQRPWIPRRTAALAALAFVGILGLLVAANVGGVRDRLRGQVGPRIQSLAVLPLANLSGDPGQDYFADGMTEAMIAELAQISALRVISRTSVMQYKGVKKPLPEIARELHVDTVIEGSVLRSEGKVRITAQLIQAVPERHLWARSYDRELRDVMAIQSDVARSVAEEIRIQVTAQEESRLQKSHTVNPEAHDAYLRGRYYRRKGNRDDLEKARQYFEQALDKDPLYAPAYAGLADYYSVLPFYTTSKPDDVLPKAKAAVARALELDDSLAEAHASLAYIRTYYDWDWADADREFQRALQLNPNDAAVRHRYSRFLSSLGRIDEALREIRLAQQLDPLSLIAKANVGVIYYFARQYDSAIKQLTDVLKEDPKFDVAYWGLGLCYEQKSMPAEAVAEMEKAAALSPDTNTIASLGHAYAIAGEKGKAGKILKDLENRTKQESISGYQFALLYAGLGDKNRAFATLERAFRERSTLLIYLKMDPRFDPLRSDPRFLQLEREIGLEK
jgi:serine/threonine protein kinase/TolB-like protein/Tfp pilus assembly protein PilF